MAEYVIVYLQEHQPIAEPRFTACDALTNSPWFDCRSSRSDVERIFTAAVIVLNTISRLMCRNFQTPQVDNHSE